MSFEHSPARQGRHAGSPRFGRIPVAEQRSGLKRGKLYQLATTNRGLFRKCGSATLVDLLMLDEILEALPAADVNVGAPDAA